MMTDHNAARASWYCCGSYPTVIRALQARRRAALGAELDAGDTANKRDA